jgi:hypothetical protein
MAKLPSKAEVKTIPIDVLEKDGTAEFEAIKEELKQDDERFKKRYTANVDGDYYIAVVFTSQDMRNEFLQKAGITADEDCRVDGVKLAKKMGIELNTPHPKIIKLRHFKRDGVELIE